MERETGAFRTKPPRSRRRVFARRRSVLGVAFSLVGGAVLGVAFSLVGGGFSASRFRSSAERFSASRFRSSAERFSASRFRSSATTVGAKNALSAAVSAFRRPFLDNFGEKSGDSTLNFVANSVK